MTWAPPQRTDGRLWCADREHLHPNPRLADVLYRSHVQTEAPLCWPHAAAWRAYAERVQAETPSTDYLIDITALDDHRPPDAVTYRYLVTAPADRPTTS
jgi:hypothetical protein